MTRLTRTEPAPGLEELTIEAASAASAHALLGEALGPAIRRVVQRRMADTEPLALVAEFRTTRAVAQHLRAKCTSSATSDALQAALRTYFACLEAWADAAELGRVVPEHSVDGRAITADELALWLQDDNTGCQTGVVRAADRSVLLFHTEEDTIGYFDRPRIVHMDVAGVTRSAFLYPYLLPGPAFGWHADGAFAYDTLNVRRTVSGGTPTSTLSWLLWWTCGALPAFETACALRPFLDGGAIAVVSRGATASEAEQIEVGGEYVHRHLLGDAAEARHVQVNMASETRSPLASIELYDDAARAPYRERLARASHALSRFGESVDVAQIARMLGSTDGDSWAFANEDVVAHFVARVATNGLSVHVGCGAARGDARFAKSWTLP